MTVFLKKCSYWYIWLTSYLWASAVWIIFSLVSSCVSSPSLIFPAVVGTGHGENQYVSDREFCVLLLLCVCQWCLVGDGWLGRAEKVTRGTDCLRTMPLWCNPIVEVDSKEVKCTFNSLFFFLSLET